MRDSGLTPTLVILESRQQSFAATLANACSNELRKLHQNQSSRTPESGPVKTQHENGRTTESISWPAPGQESVVRTVIPDDATAAQTATQRWARQKEEHVKAGVWMWWTDGSRSDDGQVRDAAVCKYRDEWRSRHSYLGPSRREVFDAIVWAIELTLEVTIGKRETLQRHEVKIVAVFSNSQAAIQQMAHLEPGPGQQLARRINRRAQALLAHDVTTEIHWVPGHSSIPGDKDVDRQVNVAHDARKDPEIERPYTMASNMARWISEGRSAAKAKWEANKCSKHFGYRLKGKAGAKRPIPMTRAKSLAARFYRPQSWHAPTGVYL